MPLLEETYVSTGKVKLIYLHFAFLGVGSLLAAQASECAGEQGIFWLYHHRLYDEQVEDDYNGFSISKLKEIANEFDINTQQFSQCLESGKYEQIVARDRAIGEANDVNSTPTIFINGNRVRGVVPFDSVAPFIEELLAGDSQE